MFCKSCCNCPCCRKKSNKTNQKNPVEVRRGMTGKRYNSKSIRPSESKGTKAHSEMQESYLQIPPMKTLTPIANKVRVSVSFAGCGFLGMFHVGAMQALLELKDKVEIHKAYGASAGSIVALALISGMSPHLLANRFHELLTKVRSLRFGPLNPTFDINKEFIKNLQENMPSGVERIVDRRLHVSLSTLTLHNKIANSFDTREEVIEAVVCSCFLPGYSGMIAPKFRGRQYIDGGYSNNQPVGDKRTITVSPFAGNAHISPVDGRKRRILPKIMKEDIQLTTKNMQRVLEAVMPKDDSEKEFGKGYKLTMEFFHSDKLSFHDELASSRKGTADSSTNPTDKDGKKK